LDQLEGLYLRADPIQRLFSIDDHASLEETSSIFVFCRGSNLANRRAE